MVQNQQATRQRRRTWGMIWAGVPMPLTVPIPVGQLMVQPSKRPRFRESSCSRMSRRSIATIRMSTVPTIEPTEALSAALLETHGPKRKDWVKWWTDLNRDFHERRAAPASRPKGRTRRQGRRANEPCFRASGRERRCGRSPAFNPSKRCAGRPGLARRQDTGEWSYQARARDPPRHAPADQEAHDQRCSIETTGSRTLLGSRQGLGDGRRLETGRSDSLARRPDSE